jgi:transcriptional regulator with XRE-family HTH domain
MPTPHNPSAAVRRALRKLGADIHDARARRRLPMAVVAERAFTSRSTLQKIEAGETNVSIGIYAGVLQALGLLDGLSQIADIGNDTVGQALASAELPKRVHLKAPARPSRDDDELGTAVQKVVAGAPPETGGILAALRRSPWVGEDLEISRPREAGRKIKL